MVFCGEDPVCQEAEGVRALSCSHTGEPISQMDGKGHENVR